MSTVENRFFAPFSLNRLCFQAYKPSLLPKIAQPTALRYFLEHFRSKTNGILKWFIGVSRRVLWCFIAMFGHYKSSVLCGVVQAFSMAHLIAVFQTNLQAFFVTQSCCKRWQKSVQNVRFFCIFKATNSMIFGVQKVQKKQAKSSVFFCKKSVAKIAFFHPRIINVFGANPSFFTHFPVFLAANRQTTGRVSSRHPPYKPFPSQMP